MLDTHTHTNACMYTTTAITRALQVDSVPRAAHQRQTAPVSSSHQRHTAPESSSNDVKHSSAKHSTVARGGGRGGGEERDLEDGEMVAREDAAARQEADRETWLCASDAQGGGHHFSRILRLLCQLIGREVRPCADLVSLCV